MLYFNDVVSNYEEFRQKFRTQEGGFKNKPLYYFYKWYIKNYPEFGKPITVRNLDDMYEFVLEFIQRCDGNVKLEMNENILRFRSSEYSTDNYNGKCEDGDSRSIRYINNENNRIFKMKSGKFMGKVFDEINEGKAYHFPEQVKKYFLEQFSAKWAAETVNNSDYTLYVNDNFSDIYDSNRCEGNFGSCMTDDDQYHFYEEAINASAAYIENADGNIVARCIIYNDVKDEDSGETGIRLAERQYSSGGKLMLKQILVDKLIAAGEIDGYKRVGASYSDASAYFSIDGKSWENRSFSIACDLNHGDTLSYQDSFKWYNYDEKRSYNNSDYNFTDCLDCCDSYFEGGEEEEVEYNSWCGGNYITEYADREWVEENCYLIGEYFYDEITEIDGEYYRNDDEDITYCEDDNEWHLKDDLYYCEDDGEYHLYENVVYCEDEDAYHLEENVVQCADGGKKYKHKCYLSTEGEYIFITNEEVVLDFYGIKILRKDSILLGCGYFLVLPDGTFSDAYNEILVRSTPKIMEEEGIVYSEYANRYAIKERCVFERGVYIPKMYYEYANRNQQEINFEIQTA